MIMTPEQQRIAIAEACGWKKSTRMVPVWVVVNYDGGGEWQDKPQVGFEKGSAWQLFDHLPDYPNDLNAMNAAEKVLAYVDMEAYASRLCVLTSGGHSDCDMCNDGRLFALLHATAAQRAEAFLRTLNLWTE